EKSLYWLGACVPGTFALAHYAFFDPNGVVVTLGLQAHDLRFASGLLIGTFVSWVAAWYQTQGYLKSLQEPIRAVYWFGLALTSSSALSGTLLLFGLSEGVPKSSYIAAFAIVATALMLSRTVQALSSSIALAIYWLGSTLAVVYAIGCLWFKPSPSIEIW